MKPAIHNTSTTLRAIACALLLVFTTTVVLSGCAPETMQGEEEKNVNGNAITNGLQKALKWGRRGVLGVLAAGVLVVGGLGIKATLDRRQRSAQNQQELKARLEQEAAKIGDDATLGDVRKRWSAGTISREDLTEGTSPTAPTAAKPLLDFGTPSTQQDLDISTCADLHEVSTALVKVGFVKPASPDEAPRPDDPCAGCFEATDSYAAANVCMTAAEDNGINDAAFKANAYDGCCEQILQMINQVRVNCFTSYCL